MKIRYFWKPIFWLAFICYGLFIPAGSLPTKPFLNIPHFDKVVHFSMFFMFCLLLFRPFKKLEFKYYFLAPLTATAFGAILEWAQRLISVSRSSDIYDFFANAIGILMATLFYYLFVSKRKWEILF